MSQTKRETNEDIDPESSSNDSSRLSSSSTSSGSASVSTSSSTGSGSNCNSHKCNHSRQSSTSEQGSDGHICPGVPQCAKNQGDQEPSVRGSSVTQESRAPIIKRDDAIQRSQSTTGRKCDTATRGLKTSCLSSPRLEVCDSDQARKSFLLSPRNLDQCPSTSYHYDRSNIDSSNTLRPVPPSSSLVLDTNNNKNSDSPNERVDFLSSSRRNNFSKSASGSRLVYRNDFRSKVCDCLSPQCTEKEHSTRRQFIENYYNSRTRLPSSTAISSLNISSPMNRLSECDAITKRLLSSPIRTLNLSENPARRVQVGEIDKSRRASLGTNTLTDQVSLFTSNQFNSLEINYGKSSEKKDDDKNTQDSSREDVGKPAESDLRHKQQQQQGRSLSVCQDDCLKRRFKTTDSNHSSNLNRAVSLACESGAPKQMMTIIPLFGCDIRALEQFMRWGLVLPPAIDSAVDHILAYGVNSIGIFRKSGVKSRILTLKQRIETNQEASLELINRNNEFSIYDIADLVKMWFRELKPMPIMTKDLIKLISEFLHSSRSFDKCETSSQLSQRLGETLNSTEFYRRPIGDNLKQQIDSIMSPTHKALFLKALDFFASISSKSEINQMTSQNLAICLTPSLCATESDQKSVIVAQRALQYCIDNYHILF